MTGMRNACGVLCLLAVPCFVTPRVLSPSPVHRVASGVSNRSDSSTSNAGASRPLLLGLVACACAAGRRVFSRAPVARKAQGWEDIKVTRTMAGSPRAKVMRKAWPWEEEDPYAKCSALKLEIGMQFSKNMLTTLNKLADSADTSSDDGLHKLMLDVVLALKRAETSWRYADCDQMLFDAEDEGRAAAGKLQRWGLEAQEKWGDGGWEKDKESRMTEYVVVTLMVSCYGAILEEKEDKIRSGSDVKRILGAISEVQQDELLQLDVQWIPEEEGDSLSAMEVTMKFPELVMI